MPCRTPLLLWTVAMFLGSTASAGLIQIAPGLELQTAWFPEVLGESAGQFSDEALETIHDSLADSGIETDGYVTMLGLDTDHGVTLAFLIDAPGDPNGTTDSSLSFQSTAPSNHAAWINDAASDVTGLINGGSGNQVAYGLFTWNAMLEGDAFAWTGLQLNDEINALFAVVETSTFPGLRASDTFRFLSAGDDGWFIAHSASFTSAGLFGFSARLAPAPGALLLLAMSGLHVRRRRS